MRNLTHNLITLIHFTELTESGWCESATERYIIATLWDLKKPVYSQQLKKEINLRFPINIKIHELELILEKMGKADDIILHENQYYLSQQKIHEVQDSLIKASNLEMKVKNNFCARVVTQNIDLEPEIVWNTFIEIFLIPLVLDEGARVYDWLTGGKKATKSSLYVENFTKSFPNHMETIKQLLFDFLNQEDPDINYYLLTYLDSYFLMSASGLPNKVLDEIATIREEALEFIIFVDTNFIYSILNLHDNPSNRAANDLQELISSLSSNIQIHLVVRQETINETLNSIKYHKERLTNTSYPPNLAEAATKIEISGIYRTFFKRVSESGHLISAEDYFAPYENNLVTILESKGVNIFEENKSSQSFEQMREVTDDIESQIQFENTKHKDSPKSERNIRHDVCFWHFIQEQ